MVSFRRTANGAEGSKLLEVKNKEEKNRKYLKWLLPHSQLWGEKALSWPGIWGLVDWIYCVSGQAEHLQGHTSYLILVC